MKVGILTYHRSQNYGAQLQAWALKSYVASLGHEVNVIDYWPEYHDGLYRHEYFDKAVFAGKSISGKVKYLARALAMKCLAARRHRSCVLFAKRNLSLSAAKSYDAIIYGSDQIWRKQHLPGCESFNPVYFGCGGYQATKMLSYAASMGPIEAGSAEDVAFVKGSLGKFAALSVREKDLQEFLAGKAGLSASLVCDPVFLLSAQEWVTLAGLDNYSTKKHILLYNLCNIPEVEAKASELSGQTGIPVARYSGQVLKFPEGKSDKLAHGPLDFLRDLYSAEYVVTSSFHGVALSLVFGKPFFYASQPGLSGRVMQLLVGIGAPSADMLRCSSTDDMTSALKKMSENSQKWLMASLDNQHGQ